MPTPEAKSLAQTNSAFQYKQRNEQNLPMPREVVRKRIFFSDLTREPLQYLIRSHFVFHL